MDDDLVIRNGFGEIKYLKQEDIVIGKTYRVRSWEDISENFPEYQGLKDVYYCPDDPYAGFVKDMKSLCGRPFTVKNIRNNAVNGEFFFLESAERTECKDTGINRAAWDISPWMLEEIEDEEPIPDGNPEELFGFLFN